MKKAILLAALVAAIGAQSASAITDAQFRAKQDSLSMAMGQLCGTQIAMTANQDSTFKTKDFMLGFMQVMTADTSRTSYMQGLVMGSELYMQMQQWKQRDGIDMSRELLTQYMQNAINDKTADQGKLMKQNGDLRGRFSEIQALVKQRLSEANQKKGADYIAQVLKTQKGWKRTASGLAYKMLEKGQGATFADTANVRITYKGTHIDGTAFDESKDTIAMDLKHVVPGFKEALTLMRPGSKMQVILPGNLAYGDNGIGHDPRSGKYTIEPGETLQFEINAIGLESSKDAANDTKQITTPVGQATKAAPAKKGIRAKSGKGTAPRGNQKK